MCFSFIFIFIYLFIWLEDVSDFYFIFFFSWIRIYISGFFMFQLAYVIFDFFPLFFGSICGNFFFLHIFDFFCVRSVSSHTFYISFFFSLDVSNCTFFFIYLIYFSLNQYPLNVKKQKKKQTWPTSLWYVICGMWYVVCGM